MFKIKLPKLRFPTWAEVKALFVMPTSVRSAVAGVERQVKSLEGVAAHHLWHAERHTAKADAFRTAARDAAVKSVEAAAEADRAVRVGGNLAALIA